MSSSESAQQIRSLMARKEAIETEIATHQAVLKANACTMHSPLVDAEGFPRDDIDVYAVRGARVRIIELRNDLSALMDGIAKLLQTVYSPTAAAAASEPDPANPETSEGTPFAKVDGVAPASPAAEAGLQRDDLIVRFGHLTRRSFTSSSLSPLVDLVAANENRALPIRVLREGQNVTLSLTPRKNWGGRGMLGCHIVPYSAS